MSRRKRAYTSELLTHQQGDVLKVGYLRKKGHVRRNWLDRWFVLTTEGVYYYKNRGVSGRTSVCVCRLLLYEYFHMIGHSAPCVYTLYLFPTTCLPPLSPLLSLLPSPTTHPSLPLLYCFLPVLHPLTPDPLSPSP